MVFRRLGGFAGAVVVGSAMLLCGLGVRAQESNLTPRGMNALAANATFSTSFTFNKSMLDQASQDMPDNLRPLVARLRSVTVHTFRYSAPGMYNEADLDAMRVWYSQDGWTHWRAQKHPQGAAVQAAPPGDAERGEPDAGQGYPDADARPVDPVRTDVWVRMKHQDVQGIVLLVANQKNVNLVVVDGTIDPLELLHLRGHFGIPRDAQ